jgi:uncharacterized protein YdhG (YjbR/CyaY superfamily)
MAMCPRYIHNKQHQIDMLRSIILSVEPKLQEHIKWNAPSYVLNGEDRITFNLMNKESLVKLILHMGATRVFVVVALSSS